MKAPGQKKMLMTAMVFIELLSRLVSIEMVLIIALSPLLAAAISAEIFDKAMLGWSLSAPWIDTP